MILLLALHILSSGQRLASEVNLIILTFNIGHDYYCEFDIFIAMELNFLGQADIYYVHLPNPPDVFNIRIYTGIIIYVYMHIMCDWIRKIVLFGPRSIFLHLHHYCESYYPDTTKYLAINGKVCFSR